MGTLSLAVDIADMTLRKDYRCGSFDLDAAVLELRGRHPDATATANEIAEALRALTCWNWARQRAAR